MDASSLLRLGVDPDALDPAPPWPWSDAAVDRLRAAPGCVACSQPATATRSVHIPGHGRRWIDRCREHLLATAHYGRPTAPAAGVLADLAAAAHEAGARLTVITDP